MPDIKTKYIPDQLGGSWEIYRNGELFARVYDSELSETLQEIKDSYIETE